MQKEEERTPIFSRTSSPDRELQLWEKWIQIRKDETTGLARKLDRPPVDLAMNLLDKVREDKERKVALEHAQIDKKMGVRGSLWERPPRLKQRCYCEPVYELRRTPAELGNPSVIEHIGVPTEILKTEMGMAGEPMRNPCSKLNADYEKYREERELELSEKIKKIDPFRPDIKGLIIKGRKPPGPAPKKTPIPEITIHGAENLPIEPLSRVYAMKVNNSVFFEDIPGLDTAHLLSFQDETQEQCTAWTYYFNVPIKRAGRSKLFIQNLGTVTLRYCWKKIKRVIPFIPEEATEQVFFFNKNEDVLSPGQSKVIFFTFISDKPGIYNEYWEFSVSNIDFVDIIGEKLVVNLYADSVKDVDMMKRKVEVLKTRINRKSINSLASEIVGEIFENVFVEVPQVYPYEKFFLEGEVFVLRNPICFYHQTEVEKMKELYTEMVPDDIWDLSIGTWRHAMMAKDFDNRMKYYELLRKSQEELLKPWYEGDGLESEKFRSVRCLLGQLADQFDREFARITDAFVYKAPEPKSPLRIKSKSKTVAIDPITAQMLRNVFYLRMYDHLAHTVELCAGILSSIDLNRYIQFDFCRHLD